MRGTAGGSSIQISFRRHGLRYLHRIRIPQKPSRIPIVLHSELGLFATLRLLIVVWPSVISNLSPWHCTQTQTGLWSDSPSSEFSGNCYAILLVQIEHKPIVQGRNGWMVVTIAFPSENRGWLEHLTIIQTLKILGTHTRFDYERRSGYTRSTALLLARVIFKLACGIDGRNKVSQGAQVAQDGYDGFRPEAAYPPVSFPSAMRVRGAEGEPSFMGKDWSYRPFPLWTR